MSANHHSMALAGLKFPRTRRSTTTMKEHVVTAVFTYDTVDAGCFPEQQSEEVDAIEVSHLLIRTPMTALAIGGCVYKMVQDVMLLRDDYLANRWNSFALTLFLTLVASVTKTLLSWRWYSKENALYLSRLHRAWRRVMVLIQQSLIQRYIDTIIYEMKSRRATESTPRTKWFRQMLFEEVDTSLLSLVECFVLTMPLLTLRSYCVLLDYSFNTAEYWGTFAVSIFLTAWTLVVYQDSIRCADSSKAPLDVRGKVVLCGWRLLTIMSRVLSLALLAYFSVFSFLSLFVLHWFVMFIWQMSLLQNDRQSAEQPISVKCLYCAMSVFIGAFTYFQVTRGQTRYGYVLFYALTITQKCLLMYLMKAAFFAQNNGLSLVGYFAVFMWCALVAGIILQISYYLLWHPKHVKRLKLENRSLKIE